MSVSSPFVRLVLSILFPTYCVQCQRFGQFLCGNCYDQVEFYSLPIKLTLSDQFLDQVIAAAVFQPPVSHLIHALKYQHVKDIGKWCGQFLYETTPFPTTEAISAVPLHPQRMNERGFNQAEVIAQELSRLTTIPYFPLLQRTRRTPHQASLANKHTRLTNQHRVFAPSGHFVEFQQAAQVPKSVILIDDVVTTGTTLNECARVLKNHGVHTVVGLTVGHG